MDSTRVSLLERIRDAGDRRAWDEFDAMYRPMLKRFALSRGLREADADDVVQHCMAAVHQHINSFEYDPARGRFKGWLRTIVNNRIRTLARGRAEDAAGTTMLANQQDSEAGPDEAFDRAWRQEHLLYCLGRIRTEIEPSTYEAFKMHVIDGVEADKVCQALGMTPNQVRVIKWRITARLRERVREMLGEEE